MIIRFIFIVAALLLAPDLATPQRAARSLYDSVARDDEAALAEHFYAEDPPHRELAAAYAHLVIQGKRLGEVAKQKFPGATDAFVQGVMSSEDVARLDEATVQEAGDRATIRLPGKSKELSFRRSDGRWRLVITDFAGASGENLAEQTKLVNEFAKAFADTADEIAADKHSTPQDAETALQTKINVVLTKAVKTVPPTTTTAPSTKQK